MNVLYSKKAFLKAKEKRDKKLHKEALNDKIHFNRQKKTLITNVLYNLEDGTSWGNKGHLQSLIKSSSAFVADFPPEEQTPLYEEINNLASIKTEQDFDKLSLKDKCDTLNYYLTSLHKKIKAMQRNYEKI